MAVNWLRIRPFTKKKKVAKLRCLARIVMSGGVQSEVFIKGPVFRSFYVGPNKRWINTPFNFKVTFKVSGKRPQAPNQKKNTNSRVRIAIRVSFFDKNRSDW